MAKRVAQGGRPGKGPRDTMITRLPVEVGQDVRQLAVEKDWSYSDTLAALIAIGLRHPHELPAGSAEQEELPLNRAS